MPVTATTKFTLRTFAATSDDQKAFLKTALTQVARGDTLALDALQEQTNLSREQLKAAAEAFVNNSLDQVFAGDRPVERGRTFGTTPPPTVTPGQGPNAEQLKTLGRQVHGLEQDIAAAKQELTGLKATAAADKKAAEEAEVGLLGDLVFWSSANKKEDAARKKAETSAAKIAPKQKEIVGLEEQVELSLRGMLANVRDVDYAHIAGRLQQVNDVRGEVARTMKVLAATSREAGNVASDERGEMFWGGRDFFIPGTDLPEGSNALSASQAVVHDYNRAVNKYNQANPDQPLTALQPIPNIDSGETIDNVVDIASNVLGGLLGAATGNNDLGRAAGRAASMGASAYVMNQVSKIKGHIDQRLRSARGSDGMLDRRHKEIRAQMDTKLNALREDALEAAGFRAA
jgi:hypothetical protein